MDLTKYKGDIQPDELARMECDLEREQTKADRDVTCYLIEAAHTVSAGDVVHGEDDARVSARNFLKAMWLKYTPPVITQALPKFP